jgi:hypothetical protein
MSKAPTQAERDLEEASRQVTLAKRRIAAAKGALQYKLKPANLASNYSLPRPRTDLAGFVRHVRPRPRGRPERRHNAAGYGQ